MAIAMTKQQVIDDLRMIIEDLDAQYRVAAPRFPDGEPILSCEVNMMVDYDVIDTLRDVLEWLEDGGM